MILLAEVNIDTGGVIWRCLLLLVLLLINAFVAMSEISLTRVSRIQRPAACWRRNARARRTC